MSRIISPPRSQHGTLRTPLNFGERLVFELFDDLLPESWEIYIQPHLNGLRPDFVLLNPAVGIAVFEVKDWNLNAMNYRIQIDSQSRPILWGTNPQGRDHPIRPNPVEQVAQYKQQVLNLYSPRLGMRALEYLGARATVTAGIIMTGASTVHARELLDPIQKHLGLQGTNQRYHPVVGRDTVDRRDLGSIFPEVTRTVSRVMEPRFADDLRSWLIEPDHAATQRERLPLDGDQRDLVEREPPPVTRYRRVKGPAGSGKSLVVAGRAARLASEGRDVLVITYNITLLHYLRDLAVRYPEPGKGFTNRITWHHFHGWCKQVCIDAGMEEAYRSLWRRSDPRDTFEVDDDIMYDSTPAGTALLDSSSSDDIINVRLPALVSGILDKSGETVPHYDAVLVDEGQDFNLEWWNVLRKICRPGAEMLLVADETQDIYERAKAWTDERMRGAGFRGKPSHLQSNYRLPESFIPHLRRYVEGYMHNMNIDLPEILRTEPTDGRQLNLSLDPIILRWLQVSPSDAIDACVSAILATPSIAEGEVVSFSDVTFLTSSHQFGLQCAQRLEAQGVNVEHVFDSNSKRQRVRKLAFFMGDARVKACTVHSFKGWETRALVVYVGSVQSFADRALVYVALTRLKRHARGSLLTVVCSAPDLEDYGRTWKT